MDEHRSARLRNPCSGRDAAETSPGPDRYHAGWSRDMRKKSRRPAKSVSRMADADSSRWSARVTQQSNALDLDPGVFTWSDPRRIARSLRRSADRSRRRKSSPYRSAMSMLTFYMNRAGRSLPEKQRRVLERAKTELRSVFGREPAG